MREARNSTVWYRPDSTTRPGWLPLFALGVAHLLWVPPARSATNFIAVISAQGRVEISRATNAPWAPASTLYPAHVLTPGDSLRTGERSRSAVRLTDLTVKQMGPNSHLTVLPPRRQRHSFRLIQGIFSFLHRDQPEDVEIESPVVAMTIRGTEFQVRVDPVTGTTVVQLFDGRVEMTNAFGSLLLEGRSAGEVSAGAKPQRTAVVDLSDALQWSLYYPGVVDLNDLMLSPPEANALAPSLAAYRQGDLLHALAIHPGLPQQGSEGARLYLAALLLSVGEVDASMEALSRDGGGAAGFTDPGHAALAKALRRWVDFVKRKPQPKGWKPTLATEWLIESYVRQRDGGTSSTGNHPLENALTAARQAVALSPEFGLAWVRVAELEFGCGRRHSALVALNRAVDLSPRNAQALALRGFLLLAGGRYDQALDEFETAIQVDGHLGNAWLGRGLGRIRRGDLHGGREDLEIAANLEPNRALLRSYLAKAWSGENETRRAEEEIRRAKELDPNDPTAWLYSALLMEQKNQFNQAIRDLDHSIELNDNRRLYRSGLLLDQDRAVRGANLARMYQQAGLSEVALREASRALASDYANPSAHLFLANSYESLRDQNRINLRYETPAFQEYLISTLLAPVGAGPLSPYVSQQEYSKLLASDHAGVVASTDYFSNGRWSHRAAPYGTLGRSSYAIEGVYDSDPGYRPNNDLRQRSTSMRIKQELAPEDTVYFEASASEFVSGDRTEYLDPAQALPGLRSRETQTPIALAGYHHEWSPESHTLVMIGRLQDDLEVTNPTLGTTIVRKDVTGTPYDILPITMQQDYHGAFTVHSAEVQQIAAWRWQTLILGGRWQSGEFETENQQHDPQPFFFSALFPFGANPPVAQNRGLEFNRRSIYAYDHLHLTDTLTLVGGLSYDWMLYPENHRFAPISMESIEMDQLSPKSGIVWSASSDTTFRGAYTRSLGGVSFDHSFQLEPAQVAGFGQSFRSLIPEALEGANSAATFETGDIAWDQRFGDGTFLSLQVEWLRSSVDRSRGVFDWVDFVAPVVASGLRERLGFTERSLSISANQLLDAFWSLGASYRISEAVLSDQFPGLPGSLFTNFVAQTRSTSLLQQARTQLRFNHPSGFFVTSEGLWTHQRSAAAGTEDFLQGNLYAGYRFARRRAELRLGLLNLGGQNYRLDPLNFTSSLPRRRLLTLGLSVSL